jgi:hypothetical protein
MDLLFPNCQSLQGVLVKLSLLLGLLALLAGSERVGQLSDREDTSSSVLPNFLLHHAL